MNRYEGYDQIPGYSRYYLEYGPLLMALAGKLNFEHSIRIINDPGPAVDMVEAGSGKAAALSDF